MADATAGGESWRDVVGYEGIYQVSDLGRVRSLERAVTYRNGHVHRYPARVLRQSVHPDGHRMLNLWKNNEGRSDAVHRLVMRAFVGPCPPGMEVCHGDGDPGNNHLANLRYDTRSNNHRDAARHGTHRNTRKSACPRGHLLVEPNLKADRLRRGVRLCRACDRATSRAYKARRKGRSAPDQGRLSDAIYAELMLAAA